MNQLRLAAEAAAEEVEADMEGNRQDRGVNMETETSECYNSGEDEGEEGEVDNCKGGNGSSGKNISNNHDPDTDDNGSGSKESSSVNKENVSSSQEMGKSDKEGDGSSSRKEDSNVEAVSGCRSSEDCGSSSKQEDSSKKECSSSTIRTSNGSNAGSGGDGTEGGNGSFLSSNTQPESARCVRFAPPSEGGHLHSLHWFRLGLRLSDNPALLKCVEGVETWRAIFILDPEYMPFTTEGNKWR